MSETVTLGIDLGTTNSSVSIVFGNEAKIALDMDKPRIPSIVHFSKNESGELCYEVGEHAKKFLIKEPEMTIFDSKLMLGRQFNDPDMQQLISQYPFKVIENEEDGGILIELESIGVILKPYEVSGYILKHLVDIGNEFLKTEQKTNRVIITIPANFGDEQREETKKAAAFAKLNLIDMINEPTSAGISYGLREKCTELKHSLIFDFGGGTLDVSLLSIQNDNFKVLASDGDMHLGGRDFDKKLTDFLIKELNIEKSRNNPKHMDKIRKAAIKAKESLSKENNFEIELELGDDEYVYNLTLEKFQEINKDLIDRILDPVDRLLLNFNFKKEDVNYIVLVGGSSKMKFVKRKLTEYFDEEPFLDINSNTAVALGAAYVAAESSNKEDVPSSIYKTFKYQDICTFSIGTLILGSEYYPIIEKNTEIPFSKSEVFNTVLYRQESIDIHLFQGVSDKIEQNYYLGYFTVSEIPPSDNPIDFILTLSLDQSGILSAAAKIKGSSEVAEKDLKVVKFRKNKSMVNHDFKSEIGGKSDIKLFLQNIYRFIDFNIDDIIKRGNYTRLELENQLKEIKFLLDNPNSTEFPDDYDSLKDTYHLKLCNYLKKIPRNEIPVFFQSNSNRYFFH